VQWQMAQAGLDYILVPVSKNDVPIHNSYKCRFRDNHLAEFMLIMILFVAAGDWLQCYGNQ
jgi:hypothetical protein